MRSQALTAVLELLSLGAVRAVCRKKGGAQLYAQVRLMRIGTLN